MTIRSLFDPSRDIYRTIEKVISYGASQESNLRTEISEYWVTKSIEEQFRNLLDLMRLAMESGGENEIGVWVSGFYGSGKSSFTKYLGLAFDDQRTIGGTPRHQVPAGSAAQAADQSAFEHGGPTIPGGGCDARLGQRNARWRHDGGCLHCSLLQGAAMGGLR